MEERAKKLFLWAIILGGTAVLLGAFGAHGLRERLSAVRLESFKTGVFYQFVHVFALLFTAFMVERSSNRAFLWASRCFLLGILCFSGSLYAISFLTAFGLLDAESSVGALGLVTPLGGVFFMVGWAFLAKGVLKFS